MPDPIEITEKDLIDRPAAALPAVVGKAVETSPTQVMGQIKDALKQFQELKKMADSMGLKIDLGKLGGLGNLLGGGGDAREDATPNAMKVEGSAMQFKMFMQLLKMKYGDITIVELLENLKKDYGKKRLSQL